ncbi:methionine/alanine import family NSS transporter small subunit [Bacillus massilinigeriensis]|nr:methionine/alanine import family NSS transporter small subunit [Bacillus massilionigeriensis]
MSAGAITMMIVGMTVIWGGLIVNIIFASYKGRETKAS